MYITEPLFYITEPLCYITEPLCYITEIGTTLSINHTSIKKIFFSEERGEI